MRITLEFEINDLDLMGLELWQRLDEIFLSQGKNAVEILQRFEMMDCKSMDTLMVRNINILSDSYLYLVDPMMYI
jgi:hypothetical protein